MLMATGTVLFLVTTQLAYLFMGRLRSRQMELDVRRALGAGPGRLARLILLEVAVLTTLAGCGAIGVAMFGRFIIHRSLPAIDRVYKLTPTDVGIRVVAFDAVTVLLALVVISLVPAVGIAGGRLSRDNVRAPARRRTLLWGDGALVAAQATVSTVVLVTSVLVLRSYVDLAWQRLGFEFDQLRVIQPELPLQDLRRNPQQWANKNLEIYRRLRERVPALLAASNGMPGMLMAGRVRDAETTDGPSVNYYAVSAEFLNVLGLRLMKGRWFGESEAVHDAPLAVVDQRAAALMWRGKDALGQHIEDGNRVRREVIGVVETVRTDITDQGSEGNAFLPLGSDLAALILLSYRDTRQVSLDTIRRVVLEVEPDAYVTAAPIRLFEYTLGRERFVAGLLGILGGLTLFLIAAGAFFIMSHQIVMRTQELAIRQALGAGRLRIQLLIMCDTLLPAVYGATAGAGVSLLWADVLASLVVGFRRWDASTLIAASVAVSTTVLVAGWVPAWRASRAPITVALHHE
jgi:hypothetical protein